MNGFSARGLRSWIARATNSLPVPLSPVMRTVDCTSATVSIIWKIAFIIADVPMMFLTLPRSRWHV